MKSRKLPFVWELDNREVKSHIIGISNFARYDYTEDIDLYLDSKKSVLHLIEKDDRKKLNEMMGEYSYRFSGQALNEILTDEEKQKMQDILKCPKINLVELLTLYHEAIVCTLLYGKLIVENLNLYDLSSKIIERAEKKEILCRGLETPEEHIEYIFNHSREAYLETIRLMINTDAHEWDERVMAYENGDGDFLVSNTDKTPDLFKCDREKRNKNIFERSIRYMNEPVLIGVGISQCIGSNSLIDLYRENSIGIRRVQHD